MITMNYAVIDSTGLVVNVIVWDGVSPWEPPVEHSVVLLEKGGIGWKIEDGNFIPPSQVSNS